MATQGPRLLSSPADGLVRWEYYYDDVTMNVTEFRCTNDSNDAALAKMWRISDPSVVYTKRTAAHTTDVVPIPQGAAARLHLTAVQTSHGVLLDGIDGEYLWPAP